MSSKTKQVIVIRKDLNMRKGKLAAQAAHSSMAFLSRRVQESAPTGKSPKFSDEEKDWFEHSYAKICVSVDSENELLSIYQEAIEKGLTVHLITDSGLTEFGGVLTNTCICIGPHRSDRIDPLTGHLKLL